MVSVASAACQLARQGLTTLDGLRVAVIGAGETSRLAAAPSGEASGRRDHRQSDARPRGDAGVGSRHQRASTRGVPDVIATTDLVVTATTAPHPVLGLEAVQRAMARRPDRPLLIIDLAVRAMSIPRSRACPA